MFLVNFQTDWLLFSHMPTGTVVVLKNANLKIELEEVEVCGKALT